MSTAGDKVPSKPIRLIAAACNNMGIGKDGRIPWNLPSELQYFLKTVSAVSTPDKRNLIICGKASWLTVPDGILPIANSIIVVLSRTLRTVPEQAHFLRQDFESAVQLAVSGPVSAQVETIWVVGGTEVYRKALEHPWCDLVFLTHVMADFDCDTFFPPLDRKVYRLLDKFPGVPHETQEENSIKYKFQVFKRTS